MPKKNYPTISLGFIYSLLRVFVVSLACTVYAIIRTSVLQRIGTILFLYLSKNEALKLLWLSNPIGKKNLYVREEQCF